MTDGFPVTFDLEVRHHDALCQFCQRTFRTDSRGLPIMDHPELGRVIVCYPCAEDLGDAQAEQQRAG